MSEIDDRIAKWNKWKEDTLKETKQYNKTQEALYFGSEDDYIREAKIYINEYVPKRVVETFLPPNKVFMKNDYFRILKEIIREFKSVEIYRKIIAEADESKDSPEWLEIVKHAKEEIEYSKKLGF
ncbi:hypothetical protein [Acidiplasma sp.]|uniref:hypothetical protein n=1 Tax=Acidiplasma sp. TaxID=1872114 RepID=UPI002587D9F5|nr:hypothetical protein [Acidiplasma sp.]